MRRRDPIDAAIRRAVLESHAGRIAQALHPAGDKRVDVAVAVVAVLGQIAQEVRIRAPRLSSSLGTGYISAKRSLQTTMLRSSSV